VRVAVRERHSERYMGGLIMYENEIRALKFLRDTVAEGDEVDALDLAIQLMRTAEQDLKQLFRAALNAKDEK
jgi:hypothetical protein